MIAPQQSADARAQLGKGKRLYQVIVGAGIQSQHPVLDRIFCCEQQNRCLVAMLPQRIQNFDAVAARQHHIQQDQIEAARAGMKEPFLAGLRPDDFVSLGLQPGA